MDLKSFSSGNTYRVLKELGRTEEFNLYLCEFGGRECILKIAATTGHNGLLDREAMLLKDMLTESELTEEDFAQKNPGSRTKLNYQLSFPRLVESFICEQQGGRRINVCSFDAAEELIKLVPIGHITERDLVRVDPKTSAWMLGKLLKTLVFMHNQGIAPRQLTGGNILVERDEHYVVIFDWTRAELYPDRTVPSNVASDEIVSVTKTVITALGGDPDTSDIPADEQDEGGRYQAMLFALTNSGYLSAREAHADFYRLLSQIWPEGGYWKYRTYPLD